MEFTLLGAAFVAMNSGSLWAATVKPMRVSQIAQSAELIFVGTATKSASYWEDGRTTIRTYLTFTNLTVKKGKVAEYRVNMKVTFVLKD